MADRDFRDKGGCAFGQGDRWLAVAMVVVGLVMLGWWWVSRPLVWILDCRRWRYHRRR